MWFYFRSVPSREDTLRTSQSSPELAAEARRRAAVAKLRHAAQAGGVSDEEIARAAIALRNVFDLGDILQSFYRKARGR